MRVFTYLLILMVVLLGLTFACLNADPVQINYYLGSKTLPLAILLVIVFTSGCLVGLLFTFWIYLKARRDKYRLQVRLKGVEKEIASLRNMSLKDS